MLTMAGRRSVLMRSSISKTLASTIPRDGCPRSRWWSPPPPCLGRFRESDLLLASCSVLVAPSNAGSAAPGWGAPPGPCCTPSANGGEAAAQGPGPIAAVPACPVSGECCGCKPSPGSPMPWNDIAPAAIKRSSRTDDLCVFHSRSYKKVLCAQGCPPDAGPRAYPLSQT